jgi:hypothetical protein
MKQRKKGETQYHKLYEEEWKDQWSKKRINKVSDNIVSSVDTLTHALIE